jgi:hypothetical protein
MVVAAAAAAALPAPALGVQLLVLQSSCNNLHALLDAHKLTPKQ